MKPSERLVRIHKNLQTLRHALRVIENSVGEIAHAEDYLGVDITCCLSGAEEQTEPKADEPMTIEKVIEKLRSRYPVSMFGDWRSIEDDLTALVEVQARRDATLCFKTGCSDCGKLILDVEGLE